VISHAKTKGLTYSTIKPRATTAARTTPNTDA
jgi:hypothetical protein